MTMPCGALFSCELVVISTDGTETYTGPATATTATIGATPALKSEQTVGESIQGLWMVCSMFYVLCSIMVAWKTRALGSPCAAMSGPREPSAHRG